MNTEPAKQASDKSVLLAELLNSNVPKSEREHIAAAEIEQLQSELKQHKQSLPTCNKHKPDGGAKSGCIICNLQSMSFALSKIDYLCGEPNEMKISYYDVHCDEEKVVESVKRLRKQCQENAKDADSFNEMLRQTGYGQGQIDAYAAQCEEIDRLHEKIKLQNKDWCDDDEAIKQQALRVLPKEVVDGDSVHVPRMGELAEMMADEIIRLRTVIHKYKTGGLRR